MKNLRTAVVGVGHLGRQHARIHAALAAEGKSEFVAVCDCVEETARDVAEERGVRWTADWHTLAGEVDAMCRRLLANPTIEEYEWEVVG